MLVSISACPCVHVSCVEDEGVLGGNVPWLWPVLQSPPRHGTDRAHAGRPSATGCRAPRQVSSTTTMPNTHDDTVVSGAGVSIILSYRLTTTLDEKHHEGIV